MGECPCYLQYFPPDKDLPSQKQQSTMRACTPARSMAASYFTYTLGKSLHVPLTSRCNSLTLPQLRGGGFTLPAHVVAALCRVRDAERATTSSATPTLSSSSLLPSQPQWAGWCAYLDSQEGQQKLPPPEPAVTRLPPPIDGMVRAPTVDELVQKINRQLNPKPTKSKRGTSNNDQRIESIVLSGEGEPTLRWNDMVELTKQIRAMVATTADVSIRLTTNGLIVPVGNHSIGDFHDYLPAMVQTLAGCGISRVSVGLITADARQYQEIVQPQLIPVNGDESSAVRQAEDAHQMVCQFIREAARVEGLEVETTAIDRPDVDKAKVEALSESLGVLTPVRWRPYFK